MCYLDKQCERLEIGDQLQDSVKRFSLNYLGPIYCLLSYCCLLPYRNFDQSCIFQSWSLPANL